MNQPTKVDVKEITPQSHHQAFVNIFNNKFCAMDYLWSVGLLQDLRPVNGVLPKCPHCPSGHISLKQGSFVWRCTQQAPKGCRGTKNSMSSCFKGTYFSGTKLPPNEILQMAHLQLSGCTWSTIRNLTGKSPNTVTDWTTNLRQLVVDGYLMTHDCESMPKIGGVDERQNPIQVQIDESLFGKSKYNRGRRSGCWIFGGVEYVADENGKKVYLKLFVLCCFDFIAILFLLLIIFLIFFFSKYLFVCKSAESGLMLWLKKETQILFCH